MKSARKTVCRVEGICCAEEAAILSKHLKNRKGVNDVKVNLIGQSVTVSHTCSTDEVLKAIRRAGFRPFLDNEKREQKRDRDYRKDFFLTVLSGLLLLSGLILEYMRFSDYLSTALFAAAIINGGWKIAFKGLRGLLRLSLDMNFLMTAAAIGAIFIGKWGEGAAVVVLFSVSLLIENFAIQKTRKTITELMNVAPPTATVVRYGSEVVVDVHDVKVGETIVLRPGERVPIDGKVLEGESSVNQAPITGESIPVLKREGDLVYAGSLNERGSLKIISEKPYNETLISRIVKKVEEAQSERAPIQTITEKFARFYTPTVFILALLLSVLPPILFGGEFSEWLYRSLVMLVIACPCALVISTPVTIVSGLTTAAKHGVLIKSGRILEGISKVKAVAFDKTGTLTKGEPKVTDVISLNDLTPQKIIEIAAAVEYRSEHPLAGAILKKAYEDNLALDPPTYLLFESLTGKGVHASFNGVTYFLGNHDLIHEQNICTPELLTTIDRLEKDGKTVIILGTKKEALGIIGIRDQVREGGKGFIQQIRREGIQKVVMLTGDNSSVAAGIADYLGIDEYFAGILPEEKLENIQKLNESYGSVAMVGDGINDAPALAASGIGIAMGGTGTDISLETADVVLMSDDLSKIPFMMRLSRKVYRIIVENIILALSIKILFLFLGSMGIATLWTAILADDGAAFLVIINGLRVLRSTTLINVN